MLKKKLEAAGLSGIRASNAAINSLPADADHHHHAQGSDRARPSRGARQGAYLDQQLHGRRGLRPARGRTEGEDRPRSAAPAAAAEDLLVF